MYQSIYHDKDTNIVHIWDDEKGYFKHKHQPYGYVEDKEGTFTHLYGFKCKKTFDLKGKVYESDVQSDTRVLVDLYSDSDAPSTGVRILKFDIEVEKGTDGHSSTEDAKNKITSIAVQDSESKQYQIFILDEDDRIQIKEKNKVLIHSCIDEKTLIKKFLSFYTKFQPHILVGWNSDMYDIPYLYNRITNVFNESIANKLSPLGIVKKARGNPEQGPTYRIAGVASLDYMELYINFTYNEESSYALEAITQKELKRGKVKYDGTLDHLYKTDINKFIDYNICDVELIDALDSKLQFIDLARAICHKGHVAYDNIYYPSSYLEGASLTFMKKIGVVAPNKPKAIKLEVKDFIKKGSTEIVVDGKIDDRVPGAGMLRIFKSATSSVVVNYHSWKGKTFYLNEPLPLAVKPEYAIKLSLIGAYVKEPIPGKYKWLFDLDLTSLYPSIIMTLNISPETKRGKVLNWNINDYVRKTPKTYEIKLVNNKLVTLSAEEFNKFIIDNNYSIAGNGVFYDQSKRGFIPIILEKWFNERVEFKDLMKVYGKRGDNDKKKYYHNLQLVQKVLLNSFYGVLALSSFRFNDLDNAEAVTSTGQQIIKYSGNCINQWFKQQLQLKETKDFVNYSDTDSCFVSCEPLLKHFYKNVQVDYKEEKDSSIMPFDDNKYKVDSNLIAPDYKNWLREVLARGKDIGYFGQNAKFDKNKDGLVTLFTDSEMRNIEIYKFQSFIKSQYTPETAIKELKVIDLVIGYASQIQKYINTKYIDYCRIFHNVTGDHRLDIKQECVSKSGIWVAKKRYAMWMVDNEGIPVNKLEVKGLDVVRSNFPLAFRKFMSNFLENILKDVTRDDIVTDIIQIKNQVESLPLKDIMSPTGVNNVASYKGETKGIPVHVKSALNYNKLLELFHDKDTPPITNGDKIKWCYVKKNSYGFETIALKGFEDSPYIESFVKEHIDYDKLFNSNMNEKLQDFFDAMNWGAVTLNTAQTKKFFSFSKT